MKLTEEQNTIIKSVEENYLTKVIAKAGTGKTSTLLSIVHAIKPKKALYIAFNRSVADEANEKFTDNVECRTIHSLAMKHVRGYEIGKFGYDSFVDADKNLGYDEKREIIKVIESFFTSGEVDAYRYFLDTLSGKRQKVLADIAHSYIEMMLEKKIKATFNFILKLFHKALYDGDVKPNYNMIMLDEAGDTTGVSLAIFKLLEADRKVMVGDTHQNIYTFMNTINGFELYEGGNVCELTHSFRVSNEIAKKVEKFGQYYLEKSFHYSGVDYDTASDKTKAYISRTNSSLILRMNDLLEKDITFTLLRDPKEIFMLVLSLQNVRNNRPIYSKDYKFLEQEYQQFVLSGQKEFFSYLEKVFTHDQEIKSAISTLRTIYKQKINIFDLYAKVKAIKPNPNVVLTTAFTAKGLEFDVVTIEDSLNNSMANAIVDATEESLVEYNLYYVACTRAKHTLHNAVHLEFLS